MRKLRGRKIPIKECFWEREFRGNTGDPQPLQRYRGHSSILWLALTSTIFLSLGAITKFFLIVVVHWPRKLRQVTLCTQSPNCLSENGGNWVVLHLILPGPWARSSLIPKSLPGDNVCSPRAVSFLHSKVVCLLLLHFVLLGFLIGIFVLLQLKIEIIRSIIAGFSSWISSLQSFAMPWFSGLAIQIRTEFK